MSYRYNFLVCVMQLAEKLGTGLLLSLSFYGMTGRPSRFFKIRATSGLHADALQKFNRHCDDVVLPLC